MAVKYIVTRGFGNGTFSPSTTGYIVTHGFGITVSSYYPGLRDFVLRTFGDVRTLALRLWEILTW